MSKKTKEVELIYTNTDQQITNITEPTVIPFVELIPVDLNPLHTKYDKYINQAKEGYLNGFTYQQAIEVLRYCENFKGIQMGLNTSCASCMIDLLRMFDRLRK